MLHMRCLRDQSDPQQLCCRLAGRGGAGSDPMMPSRPGHRNQAGGLLGIGLLIRGLQPVPIRPARLGPDLKRILFGNTSSHATSARLVHDPQLIFDWKRKPMQLFSGI